MQDDLLKPTLSDKKLLEPLYSVGALIGAGFFGGGLSVCIVAAENARRQQRLAKDAVWLILAAIVSIAVMYLAIAQQVESGETIESRTVRFANRAAGFVLAGLFYWLHRTAYRTQRFTAVDAPSPYALVFLAIVLSIGITMALLPTLTTLAETGGL